MKDKIDRKKSWILGIGLTLTAVVVSVISCVLVGQLNKTMENETNRYLEEISKLVASNINERIDNTFSTLSSIGVAYEEIYKNDPDMANQYLKVKSEINSYYRMALIDLDGNYYATDGKTTNVSDLEAFQKAKRGERAVTNLMVSPIDGNTGILFTVPLSYNNEVLGILSAWNTQEQIRDSLKIENFNGEGFSQIITQDGEFVVVSANHNAVQNQMNYFTMLENRGIPKKGYSVDELKKDIKAGNSGIFYYSLENGVEKALNYIPLKKEGWYLLSVVPTKVANEGLTYLFDQAVFVNIVIILAFLILILIVVLNNRESSKKLSEIAFVDPVTKGASRAKFEFDVNKILKSSQSGDYVLVSMDIRKFKLFNDIFGSKDGNRLLKYVYNTIIKNLNDGECAARISADTFNLILKKAPEDMIRQRMDRIAEEINVFNENSDYKYIVQIVCGVYAIDDPMLDMITLQDRANAARTNNKVSVGRQLCETTFYSDIQRLQMLREKEMENRMEISLKNEEFVVYFQPKVSLEDNQIAGAEALVRWQYPGKKMIMPNDFIPFFEKNGFIEKLDLYVFEKVCQMIRRWIDNGIKPVPISVNLSRSHLRHSDFLDKYKGIQEKYQVPANLLEIELTETMVFENIKQLMKVIDDIHDMGFTCSLDDFGSGYSSLNILKNVKVDVMKLDRAFFMEDIINDERSKNVIKSVIDLSKKLKMRSVSEGIETIDQVEFLREINCDMVQGYVFSKPIPQDIFEKNFIVNKEKLPSEEET